MPARRLRRLSRLRGRVWFFLWKRWHTSREALTVNYDIKQNQFAKLTPELLRQKYEEFNEPFDRVIKEWLL